MLPVIQRLQIGQKSQKIEEIRDFGNFEHIISQRKHFWVNSLTFNINIRNKK